MSTSYIFTYVNDQDIESFLENKTNYANKIAFLGSSGLISTHNQIYGDATKNDMMSYINDNYVSKDELSGQSYAGYSYVYDAYNYVLGEIDNMILPTIQHYSNGVSINSNDGTILSFNNTSYGVTINAIDEGEEDIIDVELAKKQYVDDAIANELANFEQSGYEIVQTLPETPQSGVRYLLYVTDSSQQGYHYEEYLYVENNWIDIGKFGEVDEASETVSGTIKLNSAQSIGVDANGKLTVGGRMGQFTGTTGLFAPNNREPRDVQDFSLLITDALGIEMAANRALAIVSGFAITVQSAAPGTTVYRATNNYINRIVAKVCENGYVSKDEATSKVEQIIKVVSVRINGSTFDPNSAADSSTPIEITLEKTANPNSTITQLRMFGVLKSYATAHLGNGVRSDNGGGRSLLVGGALTKLNGNDVCMVGQQMYSTGNGNAMFGRNHIARKNRGFLAGTGHDTTNARAEAASAVGEWSLIDSNTMFAVGNGTSATKRSNAFEVTVDGGVILKSPNGTRYKLTVANDGTLSTTAV